MNIKDSLAALKKFLKGTAPEWRRQPTPERVSKHMKGTIRATKKYADDRQKAPHNRRKHGMRKRK